MAVTKEKLKDLAQAVINVFISSAGMDDYISSCDAVAKVVDAPTGPVVSFEMDHLDGGPGTSLRRPGRITRYRVTIVEVPVENPSDED